MRKAASQMFRLMMTAGLCLTPFNAAAQTAGEAATKPSKLNAIVSIRVWSQPEVTRAIIELAQTAAYRSDRLSTPPRFFLDFTDCELRLTGSPNRRAATTPVNDRWLVKVRSAETEPGRTRVVFDLVSDDVSYIVSELANPSRLVVEFRAKANAPASPPGAASKPSGPSASEATVPAKTPQPPKITLDEMRREATVAAETKRVVRPPAASPAANQSTPTAVPQPVAAAQKPPAEPQASPAASAASATGPAGSASPNVSGNAAPARKAARSLTRALGLKLGRIVLDPGHGGHDAGTTSPGGLLEKDLVLDIALRLGKLIEEQLGAEVALTRKDDTFVSLEKRAEFANQQRADLFVSIHANSSRYANASGPETFFLNFTSSADALEVASRENATSGKTIFELEDILKKIALNDKLTESREFAEKVQAAMIAVAGRSLPKFRNRGVKRAPFVVLIGTHMPSILAEAGFLSNAREEAMLKRPEYRQKLAEGLLRGITQYAETLARFQVASRTRPASASGAAR